MDLHDQKRLPYEIRPSDNPYIINNQLPKYRV